MGMVMTLVIVVDEDAATEAMDYARARLARSTPPGCWA